MQTNSRLPFAGQRIATATLSKGGGVIRTFTVMRENLVMRDSLRMTDNG